MLFSQSVFLLLKMSLSKIYIPRVSFISPSNI
uniref:Uncharacterized protein n=1 Tax=Anguilla anguilla TaxID=7936 RepID=A0A0E9T625_ANGAN